eukprot:NODE_2969_length_390_cov_121.325513_g2887_i0.p1 GENE.NODE_2969_length_390_cov_121.325513_g2887_i0~~NODE_2969_length_390_cov_121.325513_g2887_i0.p1  ORF type:complete len:102 (-),score=24.94 NODE_2969_length_390_cov_121.325513_g2887_i0:85-390(-)
MPTKSAKCDSTAMCGALLEENKDQWASFQQNWLAFTSSVYNVNTTAGMMKKYGCTEKIGTFHLKPSGEFRLKSSFDNAGAYAKNTAPFAGQWTCSKPESAS